MDCETKSASSIRSIPMQCRQSTHSTHGAIVAPKIFHFAKMQSHFLDSAKGRLKSVRSIPDKPKKKKAAVDLIALLVKIH